jgi:polyhydroxyalkanoate synthesis regulator phasin
VPVRHVFRRQKNNPRPLAQPIFGSCRAHQRFKLGPLLFRQNNRCRVRDAFRASLNHDAAVAVQKLEPEMTFEEARTFAQRALGQDRHITIGCLIEARNEAHMTDNAADLRAEIDALKERVARLEKELAQLKMKQERAELQRRQR